MKLNHLNLPVADVATAREFFCTYFDFQSIDQKLNDTISILRSDDHFTLTVMSDKLNEKGNHTYPDAFHFGFFLNSEHEVDAFYGKLQSGGVTLPQAPQRIRRTYGFYLHHQGILIEVAVTAQ